MPKFRRGRYYDIASLARTAGGSVDAVIAAARIAGARVIGGWVWFRNGINREFADELVLAAKAERAALQRRMNHGKKTETLDSQTGGAA